LCLNKAPRGSQICIGENYKNVYGVTHRISTDTNEVASIDYTHGFVSNSVTEDVFLDLNLLRDQITRKINTRSTLQATKFTISSACSRYTKNYLIRNLSTTLLEFDIRRAGPRTGAQLAKYKLTAWWRLFRRNSTAISSNDDK
jgi:hypothetical protein